MTAGVKLTESEVLDRLATRTGISFVRWLGDYKNTLTKVTMLCDKHNEEFTLTTFVVLTNRHGGCPACNKERKDNQPPTKKTSDLVGTSYGPLGQLTVTGTERATRKGDKGHHCIVRCSVCANDPEIHGEAIYKLFPKQVRKGFLPCGCNKFQFLNESQYLILIKRHCTENNYQFLGFDGDFNGISTRVRARCLTDNQEWSTQLNCFLYATGCPECARQKHRDAKYQRAEDHIARFKATDAYPEGTTFTQRKENCYWDVTCPDCDNGGTKFKAVQDYLLKGGRPCYCRPPGGYDVKKPAHLYVLKIVSDSIEFTGYGISCQVDERIKTHLYRLGKSGFSIAEMETFSLSGSDALSIETMIGRKFPVFSQQVTGFVTESTYPWLYDDVLGFVDREILARSLRQAQQHGDICLRDFIEPRLP